MMSSEFPTYINGESAISIIKVGDGSTVGAKTPKAESMRGKLKDYSTFLGPGKTKNDHTLTVKGELLTFTISDLVNE